jgi:hypothetical protein
LKFGFCEIFRETPFPYNENESPKETRCAAGA